MRATRKLLIGSVVLACSLAVTAPSWGCDTEATATEFSTCIVSPRGDRRGVWFDLSTADALRREHEAAPVLQAISDTYRQLAVVREAEAYARKDESARLRAALAASEQATQDARDEVASSNAIIKSPWLWAPVAFAAGVALTAVVVVQLPR